MVFYDGYGAMISQQGKESENILSGKKWLPIGDSITTGGGYRGTMLKYYGLSEISGGYAGGRQAAYSSGVDHCILEHLSSIDNGTPDIITIALGTNDYGNGCPIGVLSDSPSAQTVDSFSFYGCYRKLVETLADMYPETPIVLITPFQRSGGNSKNSDGNTLSDYADAIRTIGKYYSLIVCDLYAESGLSIGTITDAYGKGNTYTGDGLHVTPYGGSIVAPKIKNAITMAIETAVVKCTYLNRSNGGAYTLTNTDPQTVYVVSDGNQKVFWESSDESIVTVTGLGNYIYAQITAVSNGTATVTAKCGDVTATFDITVALV
jgi:lysophospholipase L1-like esterase